MCKPSSKKFSKRTTMPLESRNTWMRSVKPRIYDCYGALESVAWIWRIFGVFPMTIAENNGSKKYQLKKLYALWSISLFFMSIVNFIGGVVQAVRYYNDTNFYMDSVTMLIRSTTSFVCMLLSHIWRVFSHKELSDAIEKMSEQDAFLGKMNCRLNYESSATIIRTYIWTTCGVLTIYSLYDYYTTVINQDVDWFPYIIRWVFWTVPILSQIIDLTILVTLVGLLGLNFRALNEKIKNVVARANASSPKIVVTADVCAENLKLISKAHYKLCAIAKRVNSFFTTIVIINVMTGFVIVSTTLYYIFYEVHREGQTNYLRIFTYVHWEIIHSAPTIVIVIICNWTSHQGIHAGKLIHEIRVENTDSRLYEAVKSFSLQLHHQKIQFTGGGFFPLDSTLLQTMVGNITTYLVILIQFQPKLS